MPSKALAESSPPQFIVEHARERGEMWALVRTLQAVVVFNILLAGVIWTATSLANARPKLAITGGEDLRTKVEKHFRSEGTLKTDDLAMYLHSVLTLRHTVTGNGAPFVNLLQGLVAAGLYQQTVDTIDRNITTVQSQQMAQTFVLDRLTDVDYDKTSRRVAAVVSGRFYVQAMRTKSGGQYAKEVPYRAAVIVDLVPLSDINKTGFFLVEPLIEAIGEENVRTFDSEQDARRAHISGKR